MNNHQFGGNMGNNFGANPGAGGMNNNFMGGMQSQP